MSTESWLYLWIGISFVLALSHLVNTYLWRNVIVKILALHQRIRELETENAELRKGE